MLAQSSLSSLVNIVTNKSLTFLRFGINSQMFGYTFVNSICAGNAVYDELCSDTAVYLDVEDVVNAVGFK